MSVQFTKIHSFVENLAEKQIDLSGVGLKLALTNTAHTESWDKLADLTEIAYTNLSDRDLTVNSSEQVSGKYTLKIADKVLTASGDVPTFKYIYLYDDGSTNNKLIGYYIYPTTVDMKNGDTFTVNFNDVDGVLTIE